MDRRHQSLPALDLPDYEPMIRQKPPRKKAFLNWGDEALTSILSAIYAKVFLILGLALPVTSAISIDKYNSSHDALYIYLHLGSISFLLYMFIIHYKEKSINASWNNSSNRQSDDSLGSFGNLTSNYVAYGSFYFRMGVVGFGVCSIIYSALRFGHYWERQPDTICRGIADALSQVSRIVFVLLQIQFIFSSSNYLNIQHSRVISKFGLMHMLATNICDWFTVMVTETQFDIFRSVSMVLANSTLSQVDRKFISSNAYHVTSVFVERKMYCFNFEGSILAPIMMRVRVHFLPFTIEYNILCSVIMIMMWKNNCWGDIKNIRTASMSVSGNNKPIYTRSQSKFSVDCAQAHKGLFGGIVFLAATIISLIMFSELIDRRELKDIAMLQIHLWEGSLYVASTVASIFCLFSLREVNFDQKKRFLELEHLLLLISQFGVYLYFLFQILGGILMGVKKGGVLNFMTPISAVCQSTCQTALILNAWKRRCTTEEEVKGKPGRQWITFLLILNISFWIANRLKNNRSISHPFQMDFYGVLAWNIITHVTSPFVVTYRFQSTVCFYEIWKHVYKMRPLLGAKTPNKLYKIDRRL